MKMSDMHKLVQDALAHGTRIKRLHEIDALVERMRSSSSVDELSESDQAAMMEVAVQAMNDEIAICEKRRRT
jgi:hypothetical protein